MSYTFKVSDSTAMPNHGYLLRLKLQSGTPQMKALKAGSRLRVTAPDGESAVVDIIRHATVGGGATQERLERTRELDVVIPAHQGSVAGTPIGIGWLVGPAQGED